MININFLSYFVQVSYPPGGPCGNNGYSEFCISVIESPCQGGSNNSCVTGQIAVDFQFHNYNASPALGSTRKILRCQ